MQLRVQCRFSCRSKSMCSEQIQAHWYWKRRLITAVLTWETISAITRLYSSTVQFFFEEADDRVPIARLRKCTWLSFWSQPCCVGTTMECPGALKLQTNRVFLYVANFYAQKLIKCAHTTWKIDQMYMQKLHDFTLLKGLVLLHFSSSFILDLILYEIAYP